MPIKRNLHLYSVEFGTYLDANTSKVKNIGQSTGFMKEKASPARQQFAGDVFRLYLSWAKIR